MNGPLIGVSGALLALILSGAGWVGWQLLRQNGRLLLRLEELEKRLDALEFGEDDQPTSLALDSEAPTFELPDLAGDRRSLVQYRGQPLLLIFFNPACGFCRDLVSRLAALPEIRSPLTAPECRAVPASRKTLISQPPAVLIISTGDAETNRALFAGHQVSCPVLLQQESEVAAAYQAHGTPSGYLISPEGRIASELAMGADSLLALAAGKPEVRSPKSERDQNLDAPAGGNGNGRADRFHNRSLANSKIKRDGLKAGTVAPEFRLPRLDGRGDLALSELRGRRVLLVFSSPTCGPCVALAPQLQKFHRKHPELEVVMISKGEPSENRAKVREHGLTFPVVLQQQWEVSRHYAMFATPVAYLVDEAGVVAQDVAVGTDAILRMLAGQEAPAERRGLVRLPH